VAYTRSRIARESVAVTRRPRQCRASPPTPSFRLRHPSASSRSAGARILRTDSCSDACAHHPRRKVALGARGCVSAFTDTSRKRRRPITPLPAASPPSSDPFVRLKSLAGKARSYCLLRLIDSHHPIHSMRAFSQVEGCGSRTARKSQGSRGRRAFVALKHRDRYLSSARNLLFTQARQAGSTT
jgi:hypothetical protein